MCPLLYMITWDWCAFRSRGLPGNEVPFLHLLSSCLFVSSPISSLCYHHEEICRVLAVQWWAGRKRSLTELVVKEESLGWSRVWGMRSQMCGEREQGRRVRAWEGHWGFRQRHPQRLERGRGAACRGTRQRARDWCREGQETAGTCTVGAGRWECGQGVSVFF